MNNSEGRLEQLIGNFWRKHTESVLRELNGLLKYPGGFTLISEQEARKQGITGVARTVQMRSTREEKIIDPCFEIRIVKEKFDELTDDEVLFVIAHELGHVVMKAKNSIWSEYAADVLAEHYFGIRNPKDSSVGYINN